MQMIIAVVMDHYVHDLVDGLMDQGITVTEVASSGGFLSQGNTTLMIGIDKEKFSLVDQVFEEVIGQEEKEPNKSGGHLFAIDLDQGLSF